MIPRHLDLNFGKSNSNENSKEEEQVKESSIKASSANPNRSEKLLDFFLLKEEELYEGEVLAGSEVVKKFVI